MSTEPTFWHGEGMQDPNSLSPRERELRDRFVDEYLIDFCARAAALRLGFTVSFAEGYATQFMDDPYVRRRIAIMQRASSADERSEADQTKRQIRAMLLREANFRGPGSSHAARVGALTKLMSLYDMDAPTKTKNEHLVRGGVMAVPGIASVEDWEKQAQGSQQDLQKASAV